jgi:hypothetical protein
MQIVSGLSQRTVTRLGFMFLLLGAFGAWFAYDGWVTYPQRNVEAARQAFPKSVEAEPVANPAVTQESAMALQPKADKKVSLADLRKQWGEPAYLGSASGSGTSAEQAAYFVGPYGFVRVSLEGETATKVDWRDGPKVASDIGVQRLLGIGLGGAALIPLVLLLVQMAGKYVLDDQGLVLPKVGRVAYDQMTGIDTTQLNKKGLVQLQYRDARGQAATAVLDEEKIARFEEIVAGLCEKKSWPIEVEPEEEDDSGRG